MLVLRQKIFFDYATYAKSHGQEAADRLRAERNSIADKLKSARSHNNAIYDRNVKDGGSVVFGEKKRGGRTVATFTTKGKGESIESASMRVRNSMHNDALRTARAEAAGAELGASVNAKMNKASRKGYENGTKKFKERVERFDPTKSGTKTNARTGVRAAASTRAKQSVERNVKRNRMLGAATGVAALGGAALLYNSNRNKK